MKHRIGQGVDVHQFENGAPLIIGGVSIPYTKGSKGHSDGDVLYHSIVDAILGALALGDIGEYFPSDDDRWENADSKIFLKHIQSLMKEKNYMIGNIDSTIILQNPQINPYILEMRKNIANILSIPVDSISVKATTTDKLGFIGTEDGLAAMAVVLLVETHVN